MPLTQLDYLLRNTDNIGFKLIPHVEELAMQYVFRNYVMAQRVAVKTDMAGWNVRKVSQYIPPRRAQELSEDTAIPDTTLLRARKTHIEPKEVGERYRVSDRRVDTDLESIITDIVTAIGKSIGDKMEADLHATASTVFRGGTLGSTATAYSLDTMLEGAMLMRQRIHNDQIYHAIHPYQALPVMKELIDFSGATAQAALAYRDNNIARMQAQSLTEYTLPTFHNVNLVVSDFLPRNVVFKCIVTGDGGTFRLRLGSGYTVGTHITGAITVSTVPATMIANIDAAINALPISVRKGTWVTTGTDIADLTITPPAGFYWDDEENLKVAIKYDEDATIDGGFIEADFQKSSYDLVTNPDGSYTDKDGNSLGVTLRERSASARSYMWQRSAIILDIRKAVRSYFELVMQGRTAEYSGYMTYGVGEWNSERGLYIASKADSPLSVV